MWHCRMEEKGRLNDPEPLLNQIIPRCFKEPEETVSTVEHNYNAEMGVQTPISEYRLHFRVQNEMYQQQNEQNEMYQQQNEQNEMYQQQNEQNEMYQQQMFMDDSIVMEENFPEEIIPSKELSDQYLLINGQEEQIGRNALSDISNHSFKEGPDYTYVILSPKEGVLVNNISNEVLSSCCLKARETELPDIYGMNPSDCENGNKRSSNQTQPRIIKNDADAHQHGGKEVHLCTTEVEGTLGDDFWLCPKQKDRETERSPPYMKNLCCPDIDVHNSQEEFCQQRYSHTINSDYYYDYIEELLGEGALVNIDSVQTYVDLGSGTIKTRVEVSAENEGVAVNHEVEWVTRFVQSQKLK